MKTTVSTPKVPSTPEPSKRNPAYKTITVTNSAGQCFTASAGSLVANLSVLSKKLKQDGPILAPFKFWRGDAEDFVKTYKNKRPLSERRVISAAYDRDNGEWVERYPNVAYDSEGEPVNGGHSVAGALASQENVWTIWCVLGVDPAMRPRIDVLNARGVAQQGYYVPEMYHGMEDANGNIRTDDVYSFVAASKYVMQYLCKYTGYVQGESPSVTKDKLMQIPEGIALMRAAKEHFIVLRAKLAKTGATSLMKAKFYVPALVLCLTEDPKFKKWAYALATGVGLEEDDLLLQCRNYIQEKMRTWTRAIS